MRAREVGKGESHSHPFHVGGYHYWPFLTLSWENYFRYRECSGRWRSLEVAFEKKADMWL